MTPPPALVHITHRDAWEAAQGAGVYPAPSLDAEDFIHLSTVSQVVGTANRFFRGHADDLVLLVIDPKRLRPEVRYEPADGQMFPHLYGPLNADAVVRVLPFAPRADGTFALPPELAGAG